MQESRLDLDLRCCFALLSSDQAQPAAKDEAEQRLWAHFAAEAGDAAAGAAAAVKRMTVAGADVVE